MPVSLQTQATQSHSNHRREVRGDEALQLPHQVIAEGEVDRPNGFCRDSTVYRSHAYQWKLSSVAGSCARASSQEHCGWLLRWLRATLSSCRTAITTSGLG